MKVIESLEDLPPGMRQPVITIGNFDGCHVGHQAVIKRVREVAREQNASSVLITYQDHPSRILQPDKHVELLCTPQHKLALIERCGIDCAVLLPFTFELSQQSPEDFLQEVGKHLSFSHLILGDDATIGKGRQGNAMRLRVLAEKLSFEVEHLEKMNLEGVPVSSTRVRDYLRLGQLEMAEKLIGRKYSISGRVIKGAGRGRQLGFPTANLDVSELCLPPYGAYTAALIYNDKTFPAIANLGLSPTLRNTTTPLLEVHLLEHEENLYGKEVEVIFKSYLRPEKRFDSLDDLEKQIAGDVQFARSQLS